MKKIIIAIMITSLFFSLSCTNKGDTAEAKKSSTVSINWLDNIEEAIAEAAKRDLTIFIHFTGSDWCGWCKKLEAEVYDHENFINYANENLVMVKLDYPNNIPQSEATKIYNQKMLSKYGIKGFPTVVLLDSTGKEISRTGYQPGGTENYIKHLQSIISSK